jgi:hypothetical protein
MGEYFVIKLVRYEFKNKVYEKIGDGQQSNINILFWICIWRKI